jgi:hypothetical protein
VARCAETNAEAKPKRVVVFGEMVAVLFAEGKTRAAIQLEQLWNELFGAGRGSDEPSNYGQHRPVDGSGSGRFTSHTQRYRDPGCVRPRLGRALKKINRIAPRGITDNPGLCRG